MKSQTITKADLDWKNLPFNYIKTDFNVRCHYKNGKWSSPELFADENIQMHIADPCLHYGQEAFEGMKVFETVDGRIVAFRPDENAKRLQSSSKQILIPPIPEDLFLEATHKLVAANAKFVPPFGTGASFYVRPLVLGIGPQVGLGPAAEYVFIIFGTPVGPYYKGGFKPVKALVIEDFDRAAPLGMGPYKVGGNYAAGLIGNAFGKEKGYPIILYLDPKEKKYVDEFGTSNFIGISGDKYITPASSSILPSITNKSLAAISEEMGLTIEKRQIEINEVENFDEVGAVGTAAVITPVNLIHYKGRDFKFGDGQPGPVITRLYNRLTRIQTGEDEDKFSWLDEISI
ncbi:MAG: branched-chain amino acid aminotransferase [Spirochaetes bacterium]|nr:branched-chain amino acid aminotransferase [Spirochaetota bacterium]